MKKKPLVIMLLVTYFKDLRNSEFNDFFENLEEEVRTNFATWNIPLAVKDALTAAWDIYKPLYQAIKNKKTRTSEQVEDHQEGREVAEQHIEEFANQYIIPNPLISNSKKESLGFNPKSDEHHERPVITATVFAIMDALSGSRMQFTCRTANDASRPSIAENADAVEVRYNIDTNPATWQNCTEKEIVTKAKFTINLEPTSAGKMIYAYLRWRNNTDPEKSGPWSDKISTTIRS